MKFPLWTCLMLLPAAAWALSCSPAGKMPALTTTPVVEILNAATPLAGVLAGGQPTPSEIERAAAAGFRTVINLRTAEETGFEWEREASENAGLRYVQLPVGGDGLTRDNVERFDAALGAGLDRGPVLLHCASGNRVGALLALRAAWLQGVEPDAALAIGRAAGLTRLEPRVVELLTRE